MTERGDRGKEEKIINGWRDAKNNRMEDWHNDRGM